MNSLVMSPSKKRSFMRTTLALLIILILLALASFGPERLQQLWLNPPQETVLGSLTTLDYRRDLWPWAIEAIGDFPFTGIGLGTFREAGRRFYPIPIAAQFDFAHAHNVFLQIALDLGIPGLIAYSAILIISFASAWQIATEKPPLRFYAIGFVAALAAFHIYGLADTLALGSKPAVLIWAIVGLLAAMIRLH